MSHAFQIGDHGVEAVDGGDAHENDVSLDGITPMVVKAYAPTPSLRAGDIALAVAKPAPLDTKQVLRDLRARLRVVNAEIRARKGLEAERAQIKRLLDAATAKPAAVRAIRSTG